MAVPQRPGTAHAAPASMARQIVASVIGNALEWYDFTIYGAFAVTISELFFPVRSGPGALLSTLAIFGVAYVIRPLGGLVFGHYADVVGRKRALTLVIGSMSLGMALLAFAPTYAAIGIAAPVILLAARMIQGFSVGGEFATATTFLVEHASARNRYLYGSWQFASQGAATMLGGIVGTLVSRGLSADALHAWGWRLPFMLGLVIGPIGFYMRTKLRETPEFLSQRGTSHMPEKAPVMDAFAHYKARMFCAFAVGLGGTASFYVLFVVMPSYAIRTLHLGLEASFVAPLVGGTAALIGAPVGGILADGFGRRPVLLIPVLLLLILILPAFGWLAAEPSVQRMAVMEATLSLLLGIYGGAWATSMADLFPVVVRATGMTVSYNLSVGILGGFAPVIVTWLIAITGSPLAPAYYAMAGLAVTFAALLALPEPYAAKYAA
jgi:MFS transporter, MHS family, proline/betaine transporter